MRRTLTAAALALACLVGSGCQSDTADESTADGLSWLAEQSEVTDAEALSYDDGEDTFVRVTLEPGLSDAEVDDVVHRIKEHFDPITARPSIEVDVDGFVGSVYPALVGSDPDLRRALWLRADGRATAFGEKYQSTVSTHPLVTAPAADVAALALDYDAAVSPEDDVRRSHSVESADQTTGVQWTVSDGLGFVIPTDAVRAFADTQQAHPGTTGWVDSDGGRVTGSIVLDPADVDLDDLLADPASYLDPTGFDELELGWGPARAPFGSFAQVYGDPGTRRVLDRLVRIPGVTEYEPGGVTVSDLASYEAVQSMPRPTSLSVGLERRPTLFGDLPATVFTTTEQSGPVEAVYRAVADLDAVERIELAESYPGGNLIIRPEIDDTQLRAVLTALAALPRWYEETSLFVVTPADYGREATRRLGLLGEDGMEQGRDPAPEDADLVARIEQAWADVRAQA